ncbi:MAG: amidohydrolase [Citrobacter freundii]|nr:MAG: amidohydrolase [Citrobacter freundii]
MSCRLLLTIALFICGSYAFSQNRDTIFLLRPDRVFDGEQMQERWEVLVQGNKIIAAGKAGSFSVPSSAKLILLKGQTLLPGFIEGHGHLFLHPYNEVSWKDQLLKESRAERTIRAAQHAEATLLAGFTTFRDLGTEGVGYEDVGLKQSIEKGLIPGPRLIIATRAIVATGSYGVKNEIAELDLPRGAAEADGVEGLTREVRTQIGAGADVIKVYADYRWGLNDQAMPTFTIEELKAVVEVAASSGRYVVAHASTEEGMRRAIIAGVHTIEHGTNGTPEIFRMMKEKGVALCPTISADESISTYNGWKPGSLPEPERIIQKRKIFKQALEAGVTICAGGDVGVFTHGKNYIELEKMVEYGMKPMEVLKAVTNGNATIFGWSGKIGVIRKDAFADLIAVPGNPAENIKVIETVKMVMKGGVVWRMEE